MSRSLGIGILAAALVSGAASATEITVGESKLVIDVEFWGRYKVVTDAGNGEDVISFGDPVHGTFRIFPGKAPAPSSDGAYRLPSNGEQASGASFVTSRWLSPFPTNPGASITHQVSPFPGSLPDDYVFMVDGGPNQPDYFQVSDRFGPSSATDTISGEQLLIGVRSPLDFLDGIGLDQAFELHDIQEKELTSTVGFFRAKVGEGAVAFREFFIDRLSVTPHVCRM